MAGRDGGHFALAIAVWILLVWLAGILLPALAAWGGMVLFAGLAAILLVSAVRSARR